MSKKRRNLISLLSLISATLSGCAGLELFPGSSMRDDFATAEPWDSDGYDPIAEVALALRQEVSHPEFRASRLPERQGVTMGMDMRSVRGVLGEPRAVETAGNSGELNQRWVYFSGYELAPSSPTRVVYFENGQVSGWETLAPSDRIAYPTYY